MVCFDEGHRLRHEYIRISHILRPIKARAKLIMTGTPIRLKIGELLKMISFLNPAIFSKNDDAEIDKIIDENFWLRKLQMIPEFLDKILIRRLKRDVLKLEQKFELLLAVP